MTKRCLLRSPWLVFLVLILAMVFSVSAMVNIQSPAGAQTPVETTTTAAAEAKITHAVIIGTVGTSGPAKSTINAIISPEPHSVGDSFTISGLRTGEGSGTEVRVWIFGGAAVNISSIRVNTDGSFSKTYSTGDLLPGNYYVLVVNPGPDSIFDMGVQQTGGYSDIVNTDGAVVINLTGNASVVTSAQTLADTIKKSGKDDVYAELTFQLAEPVATITSSQTVVSTPGTPATSAQGTPLPESIPVVAVSMVIVGLVLLRKE